MRSSPLKRTGGLKRTEFKRTSTLKRGKPIRRRAKRRKEWKDPEVLSNFHATFHADQVERMLRGPRWQQVKAGWNAPITLMAHHIFHDGKRVDLSGNLILITARAHHYIHDIDPIGGTVACMLGVVRRETNLGKVRDDWIACFSQHPLWWLHNAMVNEEVPEHYMDHAVEVLKAFRFEVGQ